MTTIEQAAEEIVLYTPGVTRAEIAAILTRHFGEALKDVARLEWLCDIDDRTRRVYRFGGQYTAVKDDICYDADSPRAAIDTARAEKGHK